MDFETLLYETRGRVATITLDRPDRLNAISRGMPTEIRRAVELAEHDDSIHVVVLTGAGRAFCAGYDLKESAERPDSRGSGSGSQRLWDPSVDYQMMFRNTRDFMSLWRTTKPTIARVHGHAIAGGSDIALCCDLVLMAEEALIGYPPARVWGCPTTAMWVYRLGAERAKRMLLTGDLVDGREAARLGLVLEAVPLERLDARVEHYVERIQGVPRNQLMMQKLMVNQAIEAMGLEQTQRIATLFDGAARHTPEGAWFKDQAERHGFKEAVRQRDSGEPIAEGVSHPTYRF